MAKSLRGVRLAVLLASILVGACSPAPSPSPSPSPSPRVSLNVGNGTTMIVVLVVNGQQLATVAPGGGSAVDESTLPPLPWSVAATTTSGRVLTTMDVSVGEASQIAPDAPSYGVHYVIPMGRVYLSCGTLVIWAGPNPPSGPVPPSPAGSPGDCGP